MLYRKTPFFNTTWTTVITAFLSIAIAMLALGGWLFNSEILRVFNQQWDSMKVNTALGISFSAFSLLLFASGKKNRLAVILAFIVLLLGAVTLCQYLFHWNAYIDELFFLDRITSAGHYPGRMPEITAIAFILLGISLLFYPFDKKYLHRISEFSAILVLITSFAFFISYFYSASPFFKSDQFTSNSLPTIFSGLLLSIGILYSRPDKGFLAAFHRKTIAAKLGIKGLFIIITTLVLLGWLCLKGEEAGLYNNTFSLAIRIIMYTIIFFIVTWSSTKSLNTAEMELQKSEVLYRSLVEQASDGILVTDLQGNIINVNPVLCTMFGYIKEEGLQKNIRLFLDPEDISLQPFGYHLLKDDQSHLTERLAIKKDGTKFDIELNTKLIGDNKALSIIRDISERKKAEDIIKESEMKYRTLMQQAGDSILLFSGSGELIEANQSAMQLVGYSIEEYKKMTLKDLFFEEDLKVKPFQLDRLNKGESTINRRRMKRKDGTAVETEIHAKKLSNGRYMGVARDLTERIRSEELITKERDISNSIINSLPGLFYLCDETGKILRWNSKNEIIYGYSLAEISRMNCLDFFEGEEKELVRQRIKEGFANGETSVEANIITKTGEKILFYITGLAIDFKGEKCLIGTGIDITERKKAEEGIRKSEEQYRDLVDNITDLICTHDLNGRVLSANKAAEKLIGFKFIPENNLNIKEILTADTKDNFQLYIDEIKKKGIAQGLMKVQAATGEIRIWEYNNSLKTTGTGTTIVRGYARDITEKKKTEDEIKRQKEQYDDLVKNIPVGVYKFRMKPDGRMSLDYISPRLCKMVGVKEETAYRDIMSTFKVVHPDDYSEFIRLIETSFHTEQKFLWEGRTIINDQVNWVKIESSPKLLKNGDILWDGVIADITQRKKAEEELRSSNDRFELIAKSTNDAVWEWNFESNTIWGNTTYQNLYGHSVELPVKDKELWKQRIHPDDREKIITNFERKLASDENTSIAEYRFLTESGDYKYIYDRAYIVRNAIGKPLRIMGAMQDITERKKVEAEIEEKNEALKIALVELNEIIENSTDTIFKVDITGKLIFVSPEFYRALGFTPGEMQGKHFEDIIYPEDIPFCRAAIQKGFQTKLPQRNIIYRAKTKDGGIRWANTSTSLVYNEAGEPLYILGVSKDITELTEASAMLEAAQVRYQAFIQQSLEGIWRLEIPGGISVNASLEDMLSYTVEHAYLAECNDVFARMYGYENAEKMIGFSISQVMPIDDPLNRDFFVNFIDAGFKISDAESVKIDKEGNKKFFLNNLSGIIENEKLIRLWGIRSCITERKKTSLALKASEERYKAFIQHSSEAIWRGELSEPVNCSDPVEKQIQQFYEKGYLAECNDQMAKLYGLKEASQLIGTKLSDFIRINAELTQALSNQFVQNGYRLHRTPSIQVDAKGNKRYYLNNLVGIVENGFVIRVWCMQTDITEQRLAEKKIWDLASLVDNTTDIILSHNLKLEIISWNKAAEKIYEVPASAAIGKIFNEVVSVEYLNAISKEVILQQVFEMGICNSEMLFINPAGKKIYLSATISKWYDASGRHKGFLSIAREITDVYMAREKLETSEQFYKSLISDSVDGTVVMDEKGYITYVAPSITNVLGYTIEETLGKRADEFIFRDDIAAGHKIFFDEINGVPTSWYHEVRYVSKDNRVVWMMMRAHNMLNNPYVKGIAVYFTDITKKKSTEIELYQSEERLRNSLQEVRRLSKHLQDIREEERISIAREIHDELGQQLTGLKMDLHWLSRKIKSEDEDVNNKMNKSIELINATISSVRKIATVLRPSILDDLGLIAALEWQGEEFEKRSGTKVKFINKACELTVRPEVATAIFRIYQELLTNIARHANAGLVTTSLNLDEKMLYFSITDNGVGFNKETISKKKTLGLLGIKERTLLIGGQYEIKTGPGKGVESIISIPLKFAQVPV